MVVLTATMTEFFLHYVWQYQFFDTSNIRTTNDETICIKRIGIHNTNAGPDFLNAELIIDNTIWFGDIEIHKNSNDWYSHKHNTNKAYNSVILHVVLHFSEDVICEHGNTIPTLILQPNKKVMLGYKNLSKFSIQNCCNKSILKVDTFTQNNWFDRLVIERFEQKAEQFIETYYKTNSNWEECLYQKLACNFGVTQNTLAFQALANSLPLKVVLKHSNSLVQLEALYFGQANLFPNSSIDKYVLLLQNEYNFLQKKYDLTPLPKTYWKYSRLRPQNFPDIRIAQFAQFIFQTQSLCSKLLENKTIDNLKEIFSISLHSYWDNHYKLGTLSKKQIKHLGQNFISTILINTVIPFLFAYGHLHKQNIFIEYAVNLLDQIPSENNSITSKWNELGIQSHSAFRSQALIHLSKNYCSHKNCLKCRFGLYYLQSL